MGANLNTNKKTYYMYNPHGDVQRLINWAGNLTKNYEYDVFGNEINPDSSDTNPWRYCGEYYDTETDNIYLRNRYYSPAQGRFITEDPIRSGGNWYSYCGGNPVNKIDPSGLKDYIYTSISDYTIENDDKILWVIPKSFTTNYYIEVNKKRYKVNSIETIQFYFGAPEADRKIHDDFGNKEMFGLLLNAQKQGVGFTNIMRQSIKGYLDFKTQLNKNHIYNIKGIYYDSNETGNYMWSYLLRLNNNSKSMDDILAQGGSIAGNEHRFDESWDVNARKRGEKDAEEYRKLANKRGLLPYSRQYLSLVT